MRMHRRQPVAIGSRAHPAADRFVVSELAPARRVPSANRQVIHRALRSRWNAFGRGLRESLEQYVNNALRSLDIAAGHGRRRLRIHNRTVRRNHRERIENTCACGYVARQQTAKDVINRRHRDRFDRIDRAAHLLVSAREINHRRIALDRDRCRNANRLINFAVVIEPVFRRINAIGQRAQFRPHQPRGVINQMIRISISLFESIAFNHLKQTRFANAQRAKLRGEIALALFAPAHVG